MTIWPVRPATADEIPAVARLWNSTWHEAHSAIVPPALVRLRTVKSFRQRLEKFGDDLRIAGPHGAPVGLCAIKGAELDQLFVAESERGTGLAAALLADGEARLRLNGYDSAILDCAKLNARAARFYERHGWQLQGDTVAALVTSAGPFDLHVFRYYKSL